MSARTRSSGTRSFASLAFALAGTIGYFSLLRISSIRNRPGLVLAVLGVSHLLAVVAAKAPG